MSRYRAVCHWRAIPDLHDGREAYTFEPEPTERAFDTLAEAEHCGMRFGCLAGTTRVEVFSPDGTLQALWDKTSTVVILGEPAWLDYDEDGAGIGEPYYPDKSHVSSRWQRLGDESIALGKAEFADITARLRAAGRLP